jgi:3-phosphoglycerate kinase
MTIEMDTCLMDNGPEFLYDFMKFLWKIDVTMNIVLWNGPGGGHPLVEYTGTEENLKIMLSSDEGFCCDDEDVDFYMGYTD